nr:unnamed protein product [Digitaria exilis]
MHSSTSRSPEQPSQQGHGRHASGAWASVPHGLGARGTCRLPRCLAAWQPQPGGGVPLLRCGWAPAGERS